MKKIYENAQKAWGAWKESDEGKALDDTTLRPLFNSFAIGIIASNLYFIPGTGRVPMSVLKFASCSLLFLGVVALVGVLLKVFFPIHKITKKLNVFLIVFLALGLPNVVYFSIWMLELQIRLSSPSLLLSLNIVALSLGFIAILFSLVSSRYVFAICSSFFSTWFKNWLKKILLKRILQRKVRMDTANEDEQDTTVAK